MDHNVTIDQLFENIDFSEQDTRIVESEALEKLFLLESACISRLSELCSVQYPKLVSLSSSISEALSGIKDWIYFCSDRLSNTNREIQQIDSFRTMLQLQIKNQKRLLDLVDLIVSHFGKPDEIVDIIRSSSLDSKELDDALSSMSSILDIVSVSTTQSQMPQQFVDLRALGDLRAVKERIQYVHQLASVFANRLYDEISQIQSSSDEKSLLSLSVKKYSHLISKLKKLDSRNHLELENLYEQKSRESYESTFISKADRGQVLKDEQHIEMFSGIVESIIKEGRIYLECFHGINSSGNTLNLDSKTSRKTLAFLNAVFEGIQEYLISILDTSMLESVKIVALLEKNIEKQAKTLLECEWVESTFSALFYRLESNFDEAMQMERNIIQQSTISLRKRPCILPCIYRITNVIGKMEQQISTIPSLDTEQNTPTSSSDHPFILTRNRSTKDNTFTTRIRHSYVVLTREIFELFTQFEANLENGKELIHFQATCILNYYSMYTSFREFRLPFTSSSCAKPAKVKYEEKLKEFVQLLIRTFFAPLITFFEGAEASLRISSIDVKFHPRYGKVATKNLLQQYTEKEMKKIVGGLQDRIKQLFDAEELSLSSVVIHSVQDTLISKMKNWCRILDEYYNSKDTETENDDTLSGIPVTFQFTLNELISFFK